MNGREKTFLSPFFFLFIFRFAERKKTKLPLPLTFEQKMNEPKIDTHKKHEYFHNFTLYFLRNSCQ